MYWFDSHSNIKQPIAIECTPNHSRAPIRTRSSGYCIYSVFSVPTHSKNFTISSKMPLPTSPQYFWIATIPSSTGWTPPTTLPSEFAMIKGQQEKGHQTEYLHWQLVFKLRKKQRLSGVKSLFPPETHLEPTRSAAALDYVWKEDTRVPGTQFLLGKTPAKGTDWTAARELAVAGQFDQIDDSVLIR